jgi:NAD-dependent deacetylase
MTKVLFYSGAGLSAESGISTFRNSSDGVWSNFNPDEVCNINTFFQNHEKALEFYNQRQLIYANCEPNHAHIRIAEFQEKYPLQTKIITQNVDSLLEDAGCENVIHLHGHFEEMKCLNCDNVWEIPRSKIYSAHDFCPSCKSSLVKPGIIMFGESAPKYADLISFCYNLDENDIVVVIGTSFDVVPAKWIIGQTKTQKHPWKIYANLVDLPKFGNVNQSRFDRRFIGPITKYIDSILDEVETKMKGKD